MKNIGLDYRSGIAMAAIALPVFLIGDFILYIFSSSATTPPFSVSLMTAFSGATVLAVAQGVWTKKTYSKRLQKTTRAFEKIYRGETSADSDSVREIRCSDIKQCPADHTLRDCFACELYSIQTDLEKLSAIANTLGNQKANPKAQPTAAPRIKATPLELTVYDTTIGTCRRYHNGIIRRDAGFE